MKQYRKCEAERVRYFSLYSQELHCAARDDSGV